MQVVPAYSEFTRDFPAELERHEFLLYPNQLARKWIGTDTATFGRSSQLWEETRLIFQEFYLGDENAKPGYLQREEPIVSEAELIALLTELKGKDVELGIATGRPRHETLIPLTEMGVLKYIPEERIATATSVLEAEAAVPAARPLAKPHPYSYLRALRGASCSVDELLQENLPLNVREVLIVGDSLADLLAAKALGTSFAAVLTGHEGERARGMFEQHGADHILKHVGQVANLF
jgi:phosphoglycolate phosphatase-like HAD superfamily hydrolase